MSRCDHCDYEEERICSDCENPLGPNNITGVCKACQKERDQEKADAEADAILRKLDDAGIWKKP